MGPFALIAAAGAACFPSRYYTDVTLAVVELTMFFFSILLAFTASSVMPMTAWFARFFSVVLISVAAD